MPPDDRDRLSELMESVEDIPSAAIRSGMPWDWVTYGDYLGSLDRLAKGPNVGGMVGHTAVRTYVMANAASSPGVRRLRTSRPWSPWSTKR